MTSTTDVFNQALVYEYERTPTVNQKRLKLNGSMYATYNFDNAERLQNIVNAADGATIGYTYFDDDAVQTRTYPNGVTTNYLYDNMRRLTRLTDNGPSGTLFDRQYGYNAANQISQTTEPSLSRIFTYDNVNRLLTVANGGTSENYLYDDVGNRTSSHLSSTYGYQPFNKVTSTQTATYGFDANGNTVSKSEGKEFWRYTWDNENKLVQASTRKTPVRYKYDALGRRVSRNLGYGKENTKFTYDGLDVLVDDNSGTLTKYLNGDGIDNKLRQSTGSTASYFLADHLGSTNGLTNSSGTLTSSNGYDSFGNPTNNGFSSRYQFTGREFDKFTGLQFSRARFYDPNLGRFISEDPIGFGGGDVNLYGYVWNDPTSFTDPMGHDGWDPDALARKLDRNIEYARNFWKPDEQDWFTNGVNNSVADVAHGAVDMLRCGQGFGHNLYQEDNIYGHAAYGLMDAARCSQLLATLATLASRFTPAQGEACPVRNVPASTPVGSSRSPMDVAPKNGPPLNSPGNINGRPYSGHAFDQMQGRGIPPSVVDNTIRYGASYPGKYKGSTVYYDQTNNVSVVVNTSTGRVVTVSWGQLR